MVMNQLTYLFLGKPFPTPVVYVESKILTPEERRRDRVAAYHERKQEVTRGRVLDVIRRMGSPTSTQIQNEAGLSIAHTRTLLNRLLRAGKVTYDLEAIGNGGWHKRWKIK